MVAFVAVVEPAEAGAVVGVGLAEAGVGEEVVDLGCGGWGGATGPDAAVVVDPDGEFAECAEVSAVTELEGD